jgi:hypothetical protein
LLRLSIRRGTPGNSALKAIRIVGIDVGILLRLVLREPPRRVVIPLSEAMELEISGRDQFNSRLKSLEAQFLASRRFRSVILGYYIPSYLSSIYLSQLDLLSRYVSSLMYLGPWLFSWVVLSAFWLREELSLCCSISLLWVDLFRLYSLFSWFCRKTSLEAMKMTKLASSTA